MTDMRIARRLFTLLCLTAFAVGCSSGTSDSSDSADDENRPIVINSNVEISTSGYLIESTRRVGRTVMEYTLRATAVNNSSTLYENVTATLTSVPPTVEIVDAGLNFGTLGGNTFKVSLDVFVIEVDLAEQTSLDDLIWTIEGVIPSSGGGGTNPGSGVCGSASPEQVGIFLAIDCNRNIRGESTSRGHKDWIEVDSYTEGASVSPGIRSPGSIGGLRVNFQDIVVVKSVDRSSPLTRKALAEGDIFNDVQIDIVKSCDGRPYIQYAITLTAPSIVAINASSSAGGERPTETLAFNYTRLESMYTPVRNDCRLENPIFSFIDVKGSTR